MIFLAFVTQSFRFTRREFFSESYWIDSESDCIYHFPIDLEPNGRPFGSKSIGGWWMQSDFGLTL